MPSVATISKLSRCICASIVLLAAACSSNSLTPAITTVSSPLPDSHTRSNAPKLYTSIWSDNADWVFQQVLPGRCPCKSIGYGSLSPWTLVVDTSGDVFVSNLGNSQPTISEYSPDRHLIRTIYMPIQVSMMDVDRHGVLYVMLKSHVAEYPPNATKPVRTIPAYGALTIDRHNHLFTDTHDGIAEFAPGGTTPIRTIAKAGGDWLLVDSHGILYTSEYGSFDVYEYGPKSHGNVLRTITVASGSFVQAAVLSPTDSLYLLTYVSQNYANRIFVYPTGQTQPTRKIDPPANLSFGRSTAIQEGGFLAVDSHENLFAVLNSGYDVRIAPSGKKVILTSTCCTQMLAISP